MLQSTGPPEFRGSVGMLHRDWQAVHAGFAATHLPHVRRVAAIREAVDVTVASGLSAHAMLQPLVSKAAGLPARTDSPATVAPRRVLSSVVRQLINARDTRFWIAPSG